MDKLSVNCLVLFFAVAVMFAAVVFRGANASSDEAAYWQQRAAEARPRLLNAYHPDPASVIHDINFKTQQSLEHHLAEITGQNSTRRNLGRKYRGPCLAVNPIDKCWRCKADWAVNRKRYADCAQGFGANAKGGRDGPIYVVTDSSDNDLVNPKPGTLRHAVTRYGPLWIIFSKSMYIKLNGELIVSAFKTIDGRGQMIHIVGGAGITIQAVHNVIISHIKLHDIKSGPGGMIRDSYNHYGQRGNSDGDAITIHGSHDVWLDHLSMSKGSDGLIDVVNGSTAITISNCHFVKHDKVMLFGGRDSDYQDSIMQVTVAFNHFGKNLVQRMPRIRRGFAHLVNNDYTHWLMYAIGGSHNATVISQGNNYVAPLTDITKKQVTHREANTPAWEWKRWTWSTELDQFKNGAFFVPSGDPRPYRSLLKIRPAHGRHVNWLTKFSGCKFCRVGRPC